MLLLELKELEDSPGSQAGFTLFHEHEDPLDDLSDEVHPRRHMFRLIHSFHKREVEREERLYMRKQARVDEVLGGVLSDVIAKRAKHGCQGSQESHMIS